MRLGHIVVESVMFHSCSHCANFYMIFHFCGSFHGFQGLLARLAAPTKTRRERLITGQKLIKF